MSISPLILQAQITIPPGGETGITDPTLLENPFASPMWLDEIRIRLLPLDSVGGGTGVPSGSSWSSLRVKFEMNGIPLTNGSVPLSLFGIELNQSQQTASPSIFTWKLPRPLFIPAREYLKPTFYFEPYPGAQSKTINLIYCCRPVVRGTPTPKKLQLPWVTYFKPDYVTTPGAVNTINHSTPSDLFNPWDQDLRVQRFIGRLMPRSITEEDGNMSLASANVNLSTGKVTTGTLVSAQDSFNNILIRDRTPFAHVFDFIDRAWTVNCVLPPKGFYIFTVDRLWAAYTGTLVATVGISMVGWREVQVQT